MKVLFLYVGVVIPNHTSDAYASTVSL